MIINSSQKSFDLFFPKISTDTEEFWIAALRPDLQVIALKLLFRGTVDQCTIYPRDIVRFVCLENASSFVVCHNHPSGNPKPSKQDKQITKNIFKISRLIEIPLNDHLIIGAKSYYSFADHRCLK